MSAAAVHSQYVPPTVSVDGSARRIVQPDEVVFNLSVNTTSMELQAARKENASRVAQLVTALEAQSIQPEDIQTENLRASRQYDWNNRQRVFRGFQVGRQLTVVLRDLERFEDILSALLETTEVDLNGTNFRYSKIRELDLEIRRAAVEDARAKASAMAEQLGQRIGRALQIVDGRAPATPRPPVMAQARMMSVEAAPSQEPLTAPGEIEVTARVSVTFQLD